MTGIEIVFAILFLGSVEGGLHPENSILEGIYESSCTSAGYVWEDAHTPNAHCTGNPRSSIDDIST